MWQASRPALVIGRRAEQAPVLRERAVTLVLETPSRGPLDKRRQSGPVAAQSK